jgi:NADH-quinone oxidoreductase subunit N
MTWGNFGAVTQTSIKRLMAYSSIAHAGYILLGLIAGNEWGYWGIIVYLMAYVFMNLGAFGVIIALRRKGVLGDQIEDLNGLVHTQPWMAALMLVFMLSLAGIPPTAGFAGKFLLFGGLIKRAAADVTLHPSRAWWLGALGVVAVLNTAVSLYYYFNFVKAMFVSDSTEKAPLSLSYGLKIALGVSLTLTLVIGVYPTPFINWASSAAASFAGLMK